MEGAMRPAAKHRTGLGDAKKVSIIKTALKIDKP